MRKGGAPCGSTPPTEKRLFKGFQTKGLDACDNALATGFTTPKNRC